LKPEILIAQNIIIGISVDAKYVASAKLLFFNHNAKFAELFDVKNSTTVEFLPI